MLVPPPQDLGRYRRIVVFGVTGSGKSSLAARLAALARVPYVAVDDLMWRPGWVQVPRAEQAEVIRPFAEQPAWVMDSLWSATREVVLPRTDLVLALDYPRRVSLGRLVRRTATRVWTREAICGENTESLRMALSRDSIIAWHVRSFAKKKQEIAAWASASDGPPVVHLTDPGLTDRWLTRLGS